jgi:hypothetical protein
MENVNEKLQKNTEDMDTNELLDLYTQCIFHIAKYGEGGYVGSNKTLLYSEIKNRLEQKK